MLSKVFGQCSCGNISYSTTAKPNFTLVCYCRQCQRISGGGHTAQYVVPVEETKITGIVTYWAQLADSGNKVSSGFCIVCGSPMLKKTEKLPELFFFHAATLDYPSNFVPQFVSYANEKQPWDSLNPSLVTH